MSNFDYYETLSVAPEASADEIKKAYRKLALETHPDRNPGDARSEERFKKINEAYGVLSDSGKRAQYDQYRRLGYQPGRAQGSGFGYSQEEIFKDFFTSGQAQDIFREMEREFGRMGMRFDPTFINNMFFGGRNIFFQGVIFGPGRVRVVRYGNPFATRPQSPPKPPEEPALDALKPGKLIQSGLSLLGKAGKKAGAYLLKKAFGLDRAPVNRDERKIAGEGAEPNLTYQLQISEDQALEGTIVQVDLPHLQTGKRVSVRIPAGVRTGTRLRLREMGNSFPGDPFRRGDVYIDVRIA
ncbi:MAG: DnaJ domain-containing protein [Syntrophobacteraceae bacterium]